MPVSILPIDDDDDDVSDDIIKAEDETASTEDTTIRTELSFPFPQFTARNQQQLINYMAARIPRLDYKAFNLNFMMDPCGMMKDGDDSSRDNVLVVDDDDTSLLSCYECASYYGDALDDRESIRELSSHGGLVSFGPVRVREYNRTVGDHPDVSDDGPPMTLDWDYVDYKRIPLSEYENKKARRRHRRIVRRENFLRQKQLGQGIANPVIEPMKNLEFHVPRVKGTTRLALLHQEFGVPLQEIRNAQLEVERVSKQRDESIAQSSFSEKTEELLEVAARRLKRSFSFRKYKKDTTSSLCSEASSASSSHKSSSQSSRRRKKKNKLLRRNSLESDSTMGSSANIARTASWQASPAIGDSSYYEL